MRLYQVTFHLTFDWLIQGTVYAHDREDARRRAVAFIAKLAPQWSQHELRSCDVVLLEAAA